MKPNHLFTSMLALTTIVVTSCSAPRIAQQSNNEDDVYVTTAQAKIYTPQAPVSQPASEDTYNENDEYYGTSDPYYDMDYSSRINRFYYSSPWRTYYDPYFDPYFNNGYYGYNGFSLGLSFGSMWNSPYYGWGNYYSPFWSYSPWGFNNFYGGGYYGGGYYGGGYGGGYYGGGTYTGRTTNVPRPGIGRENTPRSSFGMGAGRPEGTGAVRSDANGNVISRRSRAEMYNPNGNAGRSSTSNTNGTTQARPTRTQGTARPETQSRPTRTETYTRPEPQSRPSYTPPSSSGGSEGGGRSSGGSGSSGGGGGRSSRGGRG